MVKYRMSPKAKSHLLTLFPRVIPGYVKTRWYRQVCFGILNKNKQTGSFSDIEFCSLLMCFSLSVEYTLHGDIETLTNYTDSNTGGLISSC